MTKVNFAAANSDVRRFACTACGQCCDRGPEMELGEATALAGTFITSMIFKVHSLPLYERSAHAARWWETQGSSLPVRDALDEQRHHLSQFSVWDRVDKARGRSLHLTISAMTFDTREGRCPALSGNQCGIYPVRPLTCRTVPLHYSRPSSTLAQYLRRFTSTKGYRCLTTPDAPIVLDGRSVVDPALAQLRNDVVELANADRGWKGRIVEVMADPDMALAAGLPTLDEVLSYSDGGSATLVPMLVAWRVAANLGIISSAVLEDICRKQVSVIKSELARGLDIEPMTDLLDMLSDYEVAVSTFRRTILGGASIFVNGYPP